MGQQSLLRQERANPGLHDHVVGRILAEAPDRATPLLDLGCGSGAMLMRLRDLGYTALQGVDIAPPAALAGVGLHAVDLDNPRLPIADASLGLVLAVEVIEHLESPGAVLRELRRVIRPDGRLLLTTPNLHSVEARLRLLLRGELKQFDAIGDPTHVYPVFGFPFIRLLARHGFTPLRSWGFPENGHSPTSRPGLRLLAGLARGLGLRGEPDGDQLCMLLAPAEPVQDAAARRQLLTQHY